MDFYLSKPIHAAQLLEVVERVAGGDPQSAPVTESDGRTEEEMEVEVGVEERILDRERLMARVDGDLDLLRKMVEPFIAELPRSCGALRVAIGRQDCAAAERAAHFLKGSVGNFCSQLVFEDALRLEKMARNGDLTGAEDVAQALEQGLERLRRALLTLIGRKEPREMTEAAKASATPLA
jgi:HPt (histidine-containing phosphotransfer) domain-containing protein